MSTLSNALVNIRFDQLANDLLFGGWFHYLFPFLLIYAIVFTIMNQVEVFKKNKATKIIIAFVFASFATVFPISDSHRCVSYGPTLLPGCSLGDFMIALFPGVTAFTLGILALYIVAAILGVDLIKILGGDRENTNIMLYILGGLGAIFVIYFFGKGFGWWGYGDYGVLNWLLGPGGFLRDPLLYILAVGGFLFYWISSDGNDSDDDKDEVRN